MRKLSILFLSSLPILSFLCCYPTFIPNLKQNTKKSKRKRRWGQGDLTRVVVFEVVALYNTSRFSADFLPVLPSSSPLYHHHCTSVIKEPWMKQKSEWLTGEIEHCLSSSSCVVTVTQLLLLRIMLFCTMHIIIGLMLHKSIHSWILLNVTLHSKWFGHIPNIRHVENIKCFSDTSCTKSLLHYVIVKVSTVCLNITEIYHHCLSPHYDDDQHRRCMVRDSGHNSQVVFFKHSSLLARTNLVESRSIKWYLHNKTHKWKFTNACTMYNFSRGSIIHVANYTFYA